MSDISPDEARAALGAVATAHQHVTDEIGLPRGYWWAMAGGWVALGAIGQFAPWWVTTIATVIFGAGHATVASRLLDGRRRTTRLQVSRDTADRRIPLIVIGILVAAVALTIGIAFALQADGTTHPSLWAGIVVAAVIGFGGPDILAALRPRTRVRRA
ncbi:hypothetical protein [Gordonia sp. NB41Y]|uniref:hypothetical protein n=1 Tax=Gordonia sp. NB41Y TaxID=875808 RepID=UPI0002BF2546|nr:hypothetical protein [Gordonia sp. NB41Y]EMP12276.1 hypothetical protein ISGA_3867 [Gordonia sp. NB41Y]WLP92069.1 hypothetical protein Q9K23_07465 [Gordonia sp. NB41Y]